MKSPLNYNQIVLNRDKSLPLYLQLAGELRRLIGETRVDRGDKLPSALQFSRMLGIDRATVGKAYRGQLGLPARQGTHRRPRSLLISWTSCFPIAVPAQTVYISAEAKPNGETQRWTA